MFIRSASKKTNRCEISFVFFTKSKNDGKGFSRHMLRNEKNIYIVTE
jgi:hypothetical protein